MNGMLTAHVFTVNKSKAIIMKKLRNEAISEMDIRVEEVTSFLFL